LVRGPEILLDVEQLLDTGQLDFRLVGAGIVEAGTAACVLDIGVAEKILLDLEPRQLMVEVEEEEDGVFLAAPDSLG
jgi:hypothetical protein